MEFSPAQPCFSPLLAATALFVALIFRRLHFRSPRLLDLVRILLGCLLTPLAVLLRHVGSVALPIRVTGGGGGGYSP